MLLVVVAMAAVPPAFAGDINDPDLTDATGDSVSNKDARDLASGWVANETETSIALGLEITALDPYTPYTDVASLPVVNYEFFFDITIDGVGANWLARAIVPIHGPAAATASYILYEVTYNSQGQVTGTTESQSIVGSYDYQASEINFVVDKPYIGDPGRDDVLSGIWARTTSASQRNAEDPQTEDTMASHISPGRSFIFLGGVTFYAVTLEANETAGNATFDLPVTFEIQIQSAPETDEMAEVSLRNSSALPVNWTLRTDRGVYAVEPGTTVTALVTIVPDINATETTRKITVIGDFEDDLGERRNTANAVQLSVTIPPGDGGGPGPSGDGKTPASDGGAEALVVAVGAVVGVGAVGGGLYFVVLPRRRKRKARDRFQKLSREGWSKSPRSGPPARRPGQDVPQPAGITVERTRGGTETQSLSWSPETGLEVQTTKTTQGAHGTSTRRSSFRIGGRRGSK